jgi:hypothetical protein
LPIPAPDVPAHEDGEQYRQRPDQQPPLGRGHAATPTYTGHGTGSSPCAGQLRLGIIEIACISTLVLTQMQQSHCT